MPVISSRRCWIGSENVLLILTITGVGAGVLLGIVLWDPAGGWSKRELSYLRFPGDLFVRLLKMLILPLIVSSIISSLASLDSSTAGRLGLVSLAYYFTTTMVAVCIGITLVVIIQPGKWTTSYNDAAVEAQKSSPCISNAIDTILDLIRSLFPENLLEATFRNKKICMQFLNGTRQNAHRVDPELVLRMSTDERANLHEIPEAITTDGMNILGLVMFSIALGITISRMGQEGRPLKKFFKSLEGASMHLISLLIWWAIGEGLCSCSFIAISSISHVMSFLPSARYSPVGICFLIATQIVSTDEPARELNRLMGYVITVLLGLFLHGLVVLPLLMILLARRNPLTYVYGMTQALLTALATSSSSATLPLSIKCVEENNGVDSRVARFVLPLGATINMDGTALYEAVAALYIAQTVGHEMGFGSIVLVSLTATLASIGAAGIPQAGIVTMIMVLIAIGLPTNLFILIFPVDFFLDRIRTTVNVHGDSIGAAVVAKLCQRQLEMDADVDDDDDEKHGNTREQMDTKL